MIFWKPCLVCVPAATSLLSQCVKYECIVLLAHVSEGLCVTETQHNSWNMTSEYEPWWLRAVFDLSFSHTFSFSHSRFCWRTGQMWCLWMSGGDGDGVSSEWRRSPCSGPNRVPAGTSSVVKTPRTFHQHRKYGTKMKPNYQQNQLHTCVCVVSIDSRRCCR